MEEQNKLSASAININECGRWDKLLEKDEYSSYRQGLKYALLRSSPKRRLVTMVFSARGEDVAGAHYSLIISRGGLIRVAEISSGIVFSQGPDKNILDNIIKHFIKWALEQKASYIRINPWLPINIGDRKTDFLRIYQDVLSSNGFTVVKEGMHTYWIDLSRPDKEIMADMKRQTRYDIRAGIKSDITSEIFDKDLWKQTDIIDSFWNIYKHLFENKGFASYSESAFKEEIFNLLESGDSRLYVMKYSNQIINISMASNGGSISSYLHGALDLKYKKLEACPSPGPLAQWMMMSDVKKQGIKRYDMGFCPGPVPDKAHKGYGIWRFKYGFGGDHVEFLPVYGKKLNPVRGRIFEIIRYGK